jgi:hypothetical protein
MKKMLAALLLIALALPQLAFGWGREGHQIIAAVAEDHLDETTKVMIQSLIGNNHLYSIASWADDIRKERRETGGWHYVNIPLGSEYDSVRDCALPKSCVVAKIDDFIKVLTDKNAPREERAEALRFLVHFVGDIHQPLHAVGEAAGGNGIHVSFLQSTRCGPYDCSNLHGVWDTSMIEHTGMDWYAYVQHEEELLNSEKLARLDGGTAVQWANESAHLAQPAWVADGTSLDGNYYQKEIKVVDRQMALAGLRLAKVLNDTIGRMTPQDFAAAHIASSDQASVAPEVPTRVAAGLGNPDIEVWVNTSSGVYHCPATKWYGNTKRGEFMTQSEAQKRGYRPVGGNSCQ